MTYTGQAFSSPEEALAHYGVKGMRWGVRKDRQPDPEGYTKRMQDNDRRSFLTRKNTAVENIKKSMNEEGLTRAQAYEKELARREKINGLIVGTAVLGYQAYALSQVYDFKAMKNAAAYGVAKRAQTKRGERFAKQQAQSRGIPQQTRRPREASAKRSRRTGAYKITDL